MPEENTDKSVAVQILSAVSTAIESSTPKVVDRVVECLVEKELSKRVGTLDKTLQMRADLVIYLRKASKPDIEQYDVSGNVVNSTFSKAKLDELRKAKEQLERVESAINKAVNSNDWSKITEVAK